MNKIFVDLPLNGYIDLAYIAYICDINVADLLICRYKLYFP